MQSFNTRFNFLDLLSFFRLFSIICSRCETKRLLNKHLRTSCFQGFVFSFCVSEFPRLIHNSASCRLKYFVACIFFVCSCSCSAVMHAVCFHPHIQNSSFILPIDSAVGNVWSINPDRGKKLFSSPYHSIGCMGLTQLVV